MENVANEKKPISKDATGYEVLTAAMKDLLNQFPGLYEDEEIKYEELEEEGGIAFPITPARWYMRRKRT